jgi:hypothetical protein
MQAISFDSKIGSVDSGRTHKPIFRGNGCLPENFGYVLPGEKLGDGALISELFQTASRVGHIASHLHAFPKMVELDIRSKQVQCENHSGLTAIAPYFTLNPEP